MRSFSIILLVFSTFTACQNTTKPMQITTNQTIINNYFETFNRHEWAKMADFYTETAEFKDPTLGIGIVPQTRAQIIQKYAELHQIFPDLHDKIVQIYPSGDKNVIVEFVSSGTAPDGSKFELPICTIFTIENGKITKDFTYFDNFEEPK
jgi:ketosteroid isomerase-like protein